MNRPRTPLQSLHLSPEFRRTLFAVTFLSWLGIHTLFASHDSVWKELAPMPEGRAGMFAMISEGGEPIYLGGTSWVSGEKKFYASGYEMRNGKWYPVHSLGKAVAYAAVASGNEQLYAIGGTDGVGLRSTIIMMDSTRQIKDVEIAISGIRIYAGAALVDEVFYQIGGSANLSPLVPSGLVSKFEHGSWSDFGQLPEGPLINPSVATWGKNILVFGGGVPHPEGLKSTDSIYSFDLTDQSWTKLKNLPKPSRGAATLSLPTVGILVIGGYFKPAGSSPEVLLFEPGNKELVSLASLPMGLLLPAVVATEQWIYVFGGEDLPKHRSAHVYRASIAKLIHSRADS